MVSLYRWFDFLLNKIILILNFLCRHRRPEVIDVWDHIQIHILRKVLSLTIRVISRTILSFDVSFEI